MELRYLLYRAWHFYKQGEPLPVDLFIVLTRVGIDPEDLLKRFELGETPKQLLDVQTGVFGKLIL